jgi:RNA polymerase sigma factor (sigma-70 family)
MNAPQPILRVVDDDSSFRRATTRLLEAAGYPVRGFASATEFLDNDRAGDPGCLILDLRMPGASGLDLQETLARSSVALPILFLTGCGDIPSTVQAMKAGAVDFLTKPVEPIALLAAVRQALDRDASDRAARARSEALHARLAALTPREREVFALLVRGRLNKQIAAALGITERTIKAHRSHIMEKLQAESLAELVHIAAQSFLLDTP